jgi:hypothetical protein
MNGRKDEGKEDGGYGGKAGLMKCWMGGRTNTWMKGTTERRKGDVRQSKERKTNERRDERKEGKKEGWKEGEANGRGRRGKRKKEHKQGRSEG